MNKYTKKQQEQIDIWSKAGEELTNKLIEVNEKLRVLYSHSTSVYDSDEILELLDLRKKIVNRLNFASKRCEEAMQAKTLYEKKKKELAEIKEKWGF